MADARRWPGLSQLRLAEAVGVTQQTISKIELGDIIPLDRLKGAGCSWAFRRVSCSPGRRYRPKECSDYITASRFDILIKTCVQNKLLAEIHPSDGYFQNG